MSDLSVSMSAAGGPVPSMELPEAPAKVTARGLNFYYGENQALKNINLTLGTHRITAIIGPSGCGKSTLLRVFNRMYDLVPNARAVGSVMLDGQDAVTTRRRLELRQTAAMLAQRASRVAQSVRTHAACAPVRRGSL